MDQLNRLIQAISPTGVLLSILASKAHSDEITHKCSAWYEILSHLRHLLVRLLTGGLLSLRYFRI